MVHHKTSNSYLSESERKEWNDTMQMLRQHPKFAAISKIRFCPERGSEAYEHYKKELQRNAQNNSNYKVVNDYVY